jgi:acyl-CoA thioesterase
MQTADLIHDEVIYQKAMLMQASNAWNLLGIRLADAGKGWASMVLPFDQKLLQNAGRVHGGFLATLIDSAVASALYPLLNEGESMTTADLKVNYLRPAVANDLLAVAKIRHRGRTTALGESTIWDQGTGKEVAFGIALYMILSPGTRS